MKDASAALPPPQEQARALLERMLTLAERHRNTPDAKLQALMAWIRAEQCSALGTSGARWAPRRVIIFTEYGDTKKHLAQLLRGAVSDSHRGEERILEFHGGMSEDARAEVQRAFNADPEDHPVRILIATDAAREGINLQAHCADLFHFDVPWNPARMEQRNGRIDRTLQQAPEVRCHYFFYRDRKEDAVLRTLVQKVDRIQRELGSLGGVVMDRLSGALADGLDEASEDRLARAEALGAARETARIELESQRAKDQLRKEIDAVSKIHDDSSRLMDFDPVLLEELINVGCELAGAGRLERLADGPGGIKTFRLPPLPHSWERTLDVLRPPREKDETPWDWRKRPLLPVVFQAADRMNSGSVHLHLQHPLVQRILARFLSQGFSAHDLSRVTVVPSARDAMARVLAVGRLSLFGPGATRLHDELIPVAASWLESGGSGHLRPFAQDANRGALEQLESTLRERPKLEDVNDRVRRRLEATAPGDFAKLWKHLEAESEERAHEASRKLSARAESEASALRKILEDQRAAIEDELRNQQLELEFGQSEADQAQLAQWQQDRQFMKQRLAAIDQEVVTEPGQLSDGYRVALTRLTPVGLIYLWPQSR